MSEVDLYIRVPLDKWLEYQEAIQSHRPFAVIDEDMQENDYSRRDCVEAPVKERTCANCGVEKSPDSDDSNCYECCSWEPGSSVRVSSCDDRIGIHRPCLIYGAEIDRWIPKPEVKP